MTGKRRTDIIAPFFPLPWQVAPWRDKSPVLLLTGSAGGGKSRLAAEKVHGFCLRYPGSAWLVLRKAREWCGNSVIPFLAQSVIGPDPRVKLRADEGTFRYDNGSVIYTGGMLGREQREAVRSIGGAGGLDGAWLEEGTSFTRPDFDEVRARLRHDAGGWRQIIITTNPDAPAHWINRDLICGHGAAVYYSHAVDNPHNPPDYLTTLNGLTGVLRERLALGLWKQAEGAVYDFSLEVHVRERPESEFAYWLLCLDEGYTNPAAALLVGVDADGRLHVAREFYRAGLLQADVVALAVSWARERPISRVIVDAAAAGLGAALRDYGLPAEGHKGRVLDGIALIQDLLTVRGDQRPRLTVSPGCPNLINEFQFYVWREGRDEPLKESDHALDALRYGIHWLLGDTPVQLQRVVYDPVRVGGNYGTTRALA